MHCRPLVTSYCRKPSQGSMARIASAEDVRLEDANGFSTVVWSGQCHVIRVVWCPTLVCVDYVLRMFWLHLQLGFIRVLKGKSLLQWCSSWEDKNAFFTVNALWCDNNYQRQKPSSVITDQQNHAYTPSWKWSGEDLLSRTFWSSESERKTTIQHGKADIFLPS